VEGRQTDAQADTPPETDADTHTPPETDNPAEIQPAPDNADPDKPDPQTDVDTVGGPIWDALVCDVDPPAASTVARLVAPTLPLPRPRPSRGCSACFSLGALLVGVILPNLSLSGLSCSDISAQK
jgi:hypothetical protein